MKLLFDHNEEGDEEVKSLLGFLDGGFRFDNIKSDVELVTPELIDLVGQSVYDKVLSFYTGEENLEGEIEEIHKDALRHMQLYVISMAYLNYAPDNDLSHSNSGRSFRSEEHDKIPWEWQIQASNSSMKRRAYKALDQLLAILDKSEWGEWTNSDQYKATVNRFVKSTLDFNKLYHINNSNHLYFRLVPFMSDIEEDEIQGVLTSELSEKFKKAENLSDPEKRMVVLAKKTIIYLTLGKAMKLLPVEMFPDMPIYRETTKEASGSRAETMKFLIAEGNKYLVKLQYELDQDKQIYTPIETTTGLEDGTKYVNL